MSDGPYENTDVHLFYDAAGNEVFHTKNREGIGINVGGLVIVKPVAAWHALAKASYQPVRAPFTEENGRYQQMDPSYAGNPDAIELYVKSSDLRQVREDSQGLGEPGRLSPSTNGVPVPDAPQVEPQLVGYDECRCILTQYCDGTCRPVFALPAVLERARTLYANSPGAYRGTRPLPWDRAPMPTKLEFIGRAKVDVGRAALGVREVRPEGVGPTHADEKPE